MLLNFDYDGVIANSSSELLDIVAKAQSHVGEGRSPCATDYEEMGDHSFENWGRLLGISPNRVSGFAAAIHLFQGESTIITPLYPNVADVIRALSEKHTITIISATESRKIARVLAWNALTTNVEVILGGESNISKVERLLQILDRCNFSREDSFIIGDARSDIRAGKQAGIRTVAVTWGFEGIKMLRMEHPDYTVNSPLELMSIFSV